MINNKLSKCPICEKSFRPSTRAELEADLEFLGDLVDEMGDLGQSTCKCDPKDQISALMKKKLNETDYFD